MHKRQPVFSDELNIPRYSNGKWTVVLTLVGPSGEKNLTLDELRKLPQAEGTGGYKTKFGSIKDIRYLQGGPPESVLEKNPLVVYEDGRFKIPEME
ncbi:hypothetical protein [Thermococcus aciditolerans]|uniref:Uncharacterized protein n=1 Tax=Thermococcus aciditolerans TaxID=2598455 RepID=A0A5C0SP46_9EURY|nr:hypothetical protein [Thermococcus aciditolerans]QEK14639.1 hypothetical protein FPV09_05450 [Thermococcus aciditolerans]